jgi:hypothetical protein
VHGVTKRVDLIIAVGPVCHLIFIMDNRTKEGEVVSIIGVRLSTANPEISGSIHVWVQEFVEEVRL